MQELVPTGKLRVGVAYAPSPTPVFVAKDVNGNVRGVPLDIGTALAKALGVPVELIVAATTGELTDACSAGAIDVGFMPADDERRLCLALRERISYHPEVCDHGLCRLITVAWILAQQALNDLIQHARHRQTQAAQLGRLHRHVLAQHLADALALKRRSASEAFISAVL